MYINEIAPQHPIANSPRQTAIAPHHPSNPITFSSKSNSDRPFHHPKTRSPKSQPQTAIAYSPALDS